MINLNRSGIYLVNPNGKKLRPLDLDPRRINKVAKVNCEYLKFGKSERPLKDRYKDYKKIFGNDVNFNVILVIDDLEKLREFEKYASSKLNKYKISNPNSVRKLEWMKNITFDEAKLIILKSFNEYKEI
tara:strand:- start:278 stop:664 length:387 start_codon:yes stop_codon:yes gene_type:complete